jgi:hypothetical protein
MYHYVNKKITSDQVFTRQEATKRQFPRIPCAVYNTTIHHATSGSLSLFLSTSCHYLVWACFTSTSVSFFQIRFNAPLFRHAAITTRQHFLIVYFWERSFFLSHPLPASHQHTFTVVSVFCINCPYTEKISSALKNRARSLSLSLLVVLFGGARWGNRPWPSGRPVEGAKGDRATSCERRTQGE